MYFDRGKHHRSVQTHRFGQTDTGSFSFLFSPAPRTVLVERTRDVPFIFFGQDSLRSLRGRAARTCRCALSVPADIRVGRPWAVPGQHLCFFELTERFSSVVYRAVVDLFSYSRYSSAACGCFYTPAKRNESPLCSAQLVLICREKVALCEGNCSNSVDTGFRYCHAVVGCRVSSSSSIKKYALT